MKRKSKFELGNMGGENKRKYENLSACTIMVEETGTVSNDDYERNKAECRKESQKLNPNKIHIRSMLKETYNNR